MNELRSFITPTDMARAVGLSRSRFYSLIGSVFPEPMTTEFSSRRFYDEEGQRQCLEIRRNNKGLNGMPMFFQTKQSSANKSTKQTTKSKPKTSKYESLLMGLVALGLTGISDKEVEQAIITAFPNGISEISEEDVLRTVFINLSAR